MSFPYTFLYSWIAAGPAMRASFDYFVITGQMHGS